MRLVKIELSDSNTYHFAACYAVGWSCHDNLSSLGGTNDRFHRRLERLDEVRVDGRIGRWKNVSFANMQYSHGRLLMSIYTQNPPNDPPLTVAR